MIARRSVFLTRTLVAAVALAAASAAPSLASAQPADWPKGPITFVAPFSPGGGGDTLARLFANEFGKAMGTTFIVDNRSGAGGNIGTASVAKAPADGNTLVFGTMGTMGTNHALYKRPGYSIDDFEPVALMGTTALALVVDQASPLHSISDIVSRAKQEPGAVTCASGGNGTVSHLACAMLAQMTGVQISHIPYRSSSAAYVDIMAKRVGFMIDVMPPLAPHLAGGKLRAIAVSTKQTLPALPKVPTIAASVPGYEIFSWDGVFAPKGTPAARVDKLHAAVNQAIADPEFVQTMKSRGYTLQPMSRSAFAEFVKKEYMRMGDVVRKIGVTLD